MALAPGVAVVVLDDVTVPSVELPVGGLIHRCLVRPLDTPDLYRDPEGERPDTKQFNVNKNMSGRQPDINQLTNHITRLVDRSGAIGIDITSQ